MPAITHLPFTCQVISVLILVFIIPMYFSHTHQQIYLRKNPEKLNKTTKKHGMCNGGDGCGETEGKKARASERGKVCASPQ